MVDASTTERSNVSLGGARAKIMVRDDDGCFKLAKLPQPHDTDDVEGWERCHFKREVEIEEIRETRSDPGITG